MGNSGQAMILDAFIFLFIIAAASLLPPTLMESGILHYQDRGYNMLQMRTPAALSTFTSTTLPGTGGNEDTETKDLLLYWCQTNDTTAEKLLDRHLKNCLIPGDHGSLEIRYNNTIRHLGETPPGGVDLTSAETTISTPTMDIHLTLLLWTL